MIIRFVQGTNFTSRMIVAQQKAVMPFTPSHVEAVVKVNDAIRYIGAHYDGGVQAREPGYDAASLGHELLQPLPATPEQDQRFEAYLTAHLGEPYDWQAIAGFLVLGHHHDVNHVICSAFITGALRTCEWLPYSLPVPWHLIDPRDLLLMIGTKTRVPL